MNRKQKRARYKQAVSQEWKKHNDGAFGKSKVNRQCCHEKGIYKNRCLICGGIVNESTKK